MAEAPPPPVKVSIVTGASFNADGQSTLDGDVALVKAALLYADGVEILGLAANMIHGIGLAPGAGEPSLRDLMEWSEIIGGKSLLTPEFDAALPSLEALMTRPDVTVPDELREFLDQATEFRAGAQQMLAPVIDELVASTGAQQLKPALDAGLVTVADLGVGMASALGAAARSEHREPTEDQIQRWVSEVKRRFTDRTTRLLLDHRRAMSSKSCWRRASFRATRLACGSPAGPHSAQALWRDCLPSRLPHGRAT